MKYWEKTIPKVSNAEQADAFALDLFNALENKEISKNLYKYLLDEFEHQNADFVRSTSGYRLDRRSLGQFALGIYENMFVERAIAELWFKKHRKKHWSSAKALEKSGIANDGRLVFERGDKSAFKTPDYIIQPLGIFVDVKHCCCLHKATYKVADLEHYIDVGAYVLTGHYKYPFAKSNLEFYTLMSPEDQQKILDAAKEIRANREYGGKRAVQLENCPDEKFKEQKVKQGKLDGDSLKMTDFLKIYRF